MGALDGETVVFTGALTMKRADAQEKAKAAGAKVTGSISKNTTLVVAGKDAGSKLDTAKALGVKVISEADFEKKISGGGGRAAAPKKAEKKPAAAAKKAAPTKAKAAGGGGNISLSGKSIVFTGTLDTKRGTATAMATAAGATVRGSVSGNTDIVVAGAQAGSKLDVAKAKGITIIDEATFLAACGDGDDDHEAPPAKKAKKGRKDDSGNGTAVPVDGAKLLAQIARENPYSKPKNKRESDEIVKTAQQISDLIARMDAKLPDVDPELQFNPGCSLEDLNELEEEMDASLPWSYKLFMMRRAGTEDEHNFIFGYCMLDLDGVKSDKECWDDLENDGTFDGEPEGEDEGVFQWKWWDKGWVPISADGGGQNYCIDLNPGPNGKKGQIVYMDHECGPSSTEFGSFTEALEKLVDGLESGELEHDDEYKGLNPEFW